MGKEYKYNNQCRFCEKELTSETTSRNFINDQNYICYDCALKRMSSGGYRVRNLEQIYDPNRNKSHEEIHKKAQLHTNQMDIYEKEITKPKEKKYPDPKGYSIVIQHKEVECQICHTILTTTNAYPERVKNRGSRICKYCEYKQKIARDTDPLYKEKRELETIIHKLYARRRLKQFTWEYVEQRFTIIREHTVPQVDKEEYDKTTKLFGEEYATKRFKPKATNTLQMSFGDLSSRDGCEKLLVLFRYELYKSRHAGKRKKEKHEAQSYLRLFDPSYNMKRDENTNINDFDDLITYDKVGEQAYYNEKFISRENFNKKWDPYTVEKT
jgi:hypothetical protein